MLPFLFVDEVALFLLLKFAYSLEDFKQLQKNYSLAKFFCGSLGPVITVNFLGTEVQTYFERSTNFSSLVRNIRLDLTYG